ncbi:hypothetical protein MASR2M70_10950 [Bacillota bacterium]
MRKAAAVLFISIIILLSLSGCRGDKNEILMKYGLLIGGAADGESIGAAAEFLDDNISEVDRKTATEMVIEYREYLYNYIIQNKDKTIIQELGVYLDEKTGRIDEEKIKGSAHKPYYDLIKSGSLMITIYEGMPVLRIDHNMLTEKYGEYISDSTMGLYSLCETLIEEPTTENAGLNVDWNELLRRTYEAERLIKKYPEDEATAEEANWIYTSHINSVLMGATNTPIFSYETKEFSASAQKAYRAFILSEPDSVLTWVLNEYFDYLDSIDYTLDFNDSTASKIFFDTCDWLVSEAEKRVKE